MFVLLRSCAHRLLVAAWFLVVALWELLVFAVALDALVLGDGKGVAQGVDLYGRPESQTTMRCWLRETTSVIVARSRPGLSVMLIGFHAGSPRARRHRGPSSTAPQPSSSLQGLSRQRLEVGREFAVECRRDDVTSPGVDVDVPFIPKLREAVAEFRFDADLENVCAHPPGAAAPLSLLESDR